MNLSSFQAVRTWVFDLDNTLYPASSALFDQIEMKMREFVADFLKVSQDEADQLRASYWRDYGTTLAGLMHCNDMPPEPYMTAVHDIDFSVLHRDPALAAYISALPGRKIIYTNGSAPYARRVLEARGLSGLFESVYGVEHADWHPKPSRVAFETVFSKAQFDPATAVMFEDDIRNLQVPHAMGMGTVHVAPVQADHDHIHFHTSDLTDFLSQVINQAFPNAMPDLPMAHE
ncbi:pyrimidine 5'-nucleotidase [Algirhabdus cladophorae]|uniref:pyrimidine 5'-nucleotidase n=1 Tax=Algirhabdus cladophorae TaxID=3377108 RepID=UPI003B84A923